jgi:hypothetical protein
MTMNQNGNFTGKVAFVTGAASSIGRSTALAFARAGANVVVADIAEQSNQETARLIEEQGGRVRHVAEGNWTDVETVAVVLGTSLKMEEAIWQSMIDGTAPLVVPPHTCRQVIIDLDDYVCAYTQIELSGGKGSQLTIGWAEALYIDYSSHSKGQRDEVEGRTFVALCRDIIQADGGAQRRFEPLWWRAGRFVELLIETGNEPLTVDAFCLRETRYPLEMQSRFSSSDKHLDSVIPVALRGLQMCAHETFMDCPYYEQLMYAGDSRLEALTTYVISTDGRLPRKAIRMFGLSRLPDGLTQARYPSRDIQVIPPFSLWWIGMVYDYALWRGDQPFVAGLFADDLAYKHFSEHTQCLALLSGVLDGEQHTRVAQNLLDDASLTRATIYFNHYLFETFRLLEQPAAFFSRMGAAVRSVGARF